MPRSIELFAGGGGMALGLHAAGFEHEALVEWESLACDTLRLNANKPARPWDEARVLEMDVRDYVRELAASPPAELDLVAGGPPCQPFSLGGVHAGHSDERNMFPAALDVVRLTAPKLVVFENVPNLLGPRFRPYFDYVREQLEKPEVTPRPEESWEEHRQRVAEADCSGALRYVTHRQVINSADVGIPQARKRVFLVAARADLGVEPEDLEVDHSEDALLFDQWVDGSYWEEHAEDEEVKRLTSTGRLEPSPKLEARIARLRRSGRPSSKGGTPFETRYVNPSLL